MPEFLGKNNRSRYDRTGQSSAAGFINSRDADDTDSAKFFFVTKPAAPIHSGENTEKRERGKLKSEKETLNLETRKAGRSAN
jgi:hypothetical protein